MGTVKGFEGVAPELAERARACADERELEALVAGEGYDIQDEELLGVDGGIDWPTMPEVCSSYNQKKTIVRHSSGR